MGAIAWSLLTLVSCCTFIVVVKHRELKARHRKLAIAAKEVKDCKDYLAFKVFAMSRELERLREEAREADNSLTNEQVSKLIRLCHPDKHNNSATSNEMTQVLLSMRK